MPFSALFLCLGVFAVSFFLHRAWIAWMRQVKMGQVIKEYGPQAHMKKTGTPSMGGIVALLAVLIAVLCAALLNQAAFASLLGIWIYPFLAALVGLLDDALKIYSRSSEGLRSLRKLLLQVAVTLPWAIWAASRGLCWLPGMEIHALFAVPLLLFIGVGIQNAVNVTDGLDGLAAGTVVLSLIAALLIFSGREAVLSAGFGLAILSAFLWYNTNPALLFMGDVGAHFWAGLLLSLCVAEKSLLLIFPISFLFGIELLSSAIQIISIRGFGRKVFKMSPLHHHFELCGWGEPRIVTRFWLIHAVGMAAILAVIASAGKGGA